MSASNATWLVAHADVIILIVSLIFVAPFLQACARAAMPSPSTPSLWPSGRFYCSFVAVAFTVVFVKSLVEAIARSNAAPHDGSTIVYVAIGYLWCTFWFWAAMLGFMAARKG
jgi:membrane glycosyltransferase